MLCLEAKSEAMEDSSHMHKMRLSSLRLEGFVERGHDRFHDTSQSSKRCADEWGMHLTLVQVGQVSREWS